MYVYTSNNPSSSIDYFGLYRIIICKASKKLYVCDEKKSEMEANVVVGCPDYDTPEGTFAAGAWIKNKTNPKYGPIPWDKDRKNPYGPWFLPINKQGKYTSYGIHGTAGYGWSPFLTPPIPRGIMEWIDDENRFLYCSHGCVRMSNPDIEELHSLLPNSVGTEISIRKECKRENPCCQE